MGSEGIFIEKWMVDALIPSVGGAVDELMMAMALNEWVSVGVIVMLSSKSWIPLRP